MRIPQIVILLFTFLFIFSCNTFESKKKTSDAETLFTLIPSEQSKIKFSNNVIQDNNFNCVRYMYALNGGGVAVGDINNDGLQDVYFTSNQESNKLYLVWQRHDIRGTGKLELADLLHGSRDLPFTQRRTREPIDDGGLRLHDGGEPELLDEPRHVHAAHAAQGVGDRGRRLQEGHEVFRRLHCR